MKLTKSSIMTLDVEKQIKTLREYIQSLIGRFGSDQINRDKLVPYLLGSLNHC